jgi:hypothetical protein
LNIIGIKQGDIPEGLELPFPLVTVLQAKSEIGNLVFHLNIEGKFRQGIATKGILLSGEKEMSITTLQGETTEQIVETGNDPGNGFIDHFCV